MDKYRAILKELGWECVDEELVDGAEVYVRSSEYITGCSDLDTVTIAGEVILFGKVTKTFTPGEDFRDWVSK